MAELGARLAPACGLRVGLHVLEDVLLLLRELVVVDSLRGAR